jgi:hypothetical protein
MWRPPQTPLDKLLEEAVADTIVSDLIDGTLHVLDRRDLARRAALECFRPALRSEAEHMPPPRRPEPS